MSRVGLGRRRTEKESADDGCRISHRSPMSTSLATFAVPTEEPVIGSKRIPLWNACSLGSDCNAKRTMAELSRPRKSTNCLRPMTPHFSSFAFHWCMDRSGFGYMLIKKLECSASHNNQHGAGGICTAFYFHTLQS
jgi:hypothetical protein